MSKGDEIAANGETARYMPIFVMLQYFRILFLYKTHTISFSAVNRARLLLNKTLYQTIPYFHDHRKIKKRCGKRRKCWLPTFSPFPTMFSFLLMSNHIIQTTGIFHVSPSNALKLGLPRTLSSS